MSSSSRSSSSASASWASRSSCSVITGKLPGGGAGSVVGRGLVLSLRALGELLAQVVGLVGAARVRVLGRLLGLLRFSRALDSARWI